MASLKQHRFEYSSVSTNELSSQQIEALHSSARQIGRNHGVHTEGAGAVCSARVHNPSGMAASAGLFGGPEGDNTGSLEAVISGASIRATNVNTGVGHSTISDPLGEYRIALLQPGEYEVRVEIAGFAPQRRRNIVLTVGQTAVIDFTLQVGTVANEVEVTASVPVVEAERTHQAETVTQRPIQNLPINGRNFLNFSLLTPGVVEQSPAVTNSLLPELSRQLLRIFPS